MSTKVKQLWVEKYRPKTVNDVVLSSPLHAKKFAEYIKQGEIPNLLLYGGPGTGKTTISKALINDLGVHRNDTMRINCSDEKIDAVRDKVKAFAMTMPYGKFKVVQLEEFDNIGLDAQKLLRALIEECSSITRFIATCNYVHQLIPAIRSRFQEFSFNAPSYEQVLIRGADILMEENIDFDIDTLEKITALAYPDFRKVVQLLEASAIDGKLVLNTETEVANDWKLQLFDLIKTGDFQQARKIVCSSAGKDELIDIYRFLYLNIHKCESIKADLNQAYILLARYQYQHAFVADPELQIAALFIELSGLK